MAAPLAEPADIEAIWRTLEPAEVVQANALITIASAKLRAAVAFDLDARIAQFGQPVPSTPTVPPTPPGLDPIVVANVVATMVKRVLVNPDGLAATTQTFGPISEQRTYQGRSANGDTTDRGGEIVVTAADLGELIPTKKPSRVRTLSVGLQDSIDPPVGYTRGYPGLYPNGWYGS